MKDKGLLAKKIPTALGLFILIGGLIAGVILVSRSQSQSLGAKAGPTASPRNVKITNLGTNGFSVSWTTDTPVTGFVKYSENPAKITLPAGDARDQISGSSQSYTNHYVNISGLAADKTYYFVIGSGPQTYNDSGSPFQVHTTQQVAPAAEDVIFGKVLTDAGAPVNGAIVYVDVEGGEPVSDLSKTTGEWRINLGAARTKDGAVLNYDKDKTLLSIFVQAGISGSATAITNTAKARPVPDISLGKNQTFIEAVPSQLSQAQTENAQKVGEGFKTLAAQQAPAIDVAATSEATGSVQILNPGINGEMVATSSPQFKGKALPGTDIKITVHSAVELSQLIKADATGIWSWTPPQNLEPGLHTLTLDYLDEKGVPQKIERTFTVLAADAYGSLPSFTATPSAVVVTPTASPSAAPIAIITPKATVTPTPTIVTMMPATKSAELKDTGTVTNTIALMSLGLGMVLAGSVMKKKYKNY